SSADAAPAVPPAPPKRSPGHRGADIRDTVAEMAARAQEISLEAGSKMTSALRDVIGAAAGLSSFAIESARDLVQYMVRRGQMTQEDADKLIKEAEEANAKRKPSAPVSSPMGRSSTTAAPMPTRPVAPPVRPPVAAVAAPAPTAPRPA